MITIRIIREEDSKDLMIWRTAIPIIPHVGETFRLSYPGIDNDKQLLRVTEVCHVPDITQEDGFQEVSRYEVQIVVTLLTTSMPISPLPEDWYPSGPRPRRRSK